MDSQATLPLPLPRLPSFQELCESISSSNYDIQETTQNALKTPRRERALPTTRSDRIRIKTALDFGHSWAEIEKKYGFTQRQIQYASESQITPQGHRAGRRPLLKTPQRRRLEQWLQ